VGECLGSRDLGLIMIWEGNWRAEGREREDLGSESYGRGAFSKMGSRIRMQTSDRG